MMIIVVLLHNIVYNQVVLPGGFTLSGDSSVGTISGTETGSTATTTYSFTIRATDNDGQTTDRAFTITVTHGASGGGQFN